MSAAARKIHVEASALAFRIPLAVIAVAVLDHAFVSREPGTTAAEHLSSGLVPVAIALVLAWAYPRDPRLRAAIRARSPRIPPNTSGGSSASSTRRSVSGFPRIR